MKQIDLDLNESDETIRKTQVKDFLKRNKLSQYYNILINEGFDSLLSLFDITESDLEALNVKRGHRRLMQRAIATARGVPISTPIIINYGYDELSTSHTPKPGTFKLSGDDNLTRTNYATSDNNYSTSSRDKRHYHSRKKRKQYIPARPVTAFDEYMNQVHFELKDLTPSELKSFASERWNSFNAVDKEKYERKALHANSNYVMDLFPFENDTDSVETLL